jgi:hypothetical protein
MPEKPKSSAGNISQVIFDQFWDCAAKYDIPPEIVERLRDALISKKDWSEKAIRAALFQPGARAWTT